MFKPFKKLAKKGVKSAKAAPAKAAPAKGNPFAKGKAKPKAKAKASKKAKGKAADKAERSTMVQLGGFPPIKTKKGKKSFKLFG